MTKKVMIVNPNVRHESFALTFSDDKEFNYKYWFWKDRASVIVYSIDPDGVLSYDSSLSTI